MWSGRIEGSRDPNVAGKHGGLSASMSDSRESVCEERKGNEMKKNPKTSVLRYSSKELFIGRTSTYSKGEGNRCLLLLLLGMTNLVR